MRSTIAALVLALTLAVAFYFIGLTSKQSQAKTSEKRTAEEEQLVVSPNTVKTHRNRLYAKLDVHDRQELLDKYLIEKPKQA